MKFLRANIYGFGKWVDHSIDFSGRSTIVYGENESGKSTIQMFLLFMLFGLPPRKRAYYRPKTSGKLGGRLTVFDPEVGEFIIERLDEVKNGSAVCYTADGGKHDETWLKQRLKGISLETYQSIFAFSAMDLNDLHTVRDEEVGEILLGIGLTGSKNIHMIEKELDKEIGKRFKPFGTKPEINVQLEKLMKLEKELNEAKEKEAAYSQKKEDLSGLHEQLVEVKKQLKTEQTSYQQIENKKQALPLLKEYVMLQERRASLPKEIPFPENGKERLEKQQELLLPLKSEYDFLQANQKQSEQKLTMLTEQETNRTRYERAKKMLEQKPAYLAKIKEVEQMENRVQKKEAQLNAKLNSLSLPLELSELGELEFPFYTENNWLELKKEAEYLQAEKEQLETERKTLHEEQHILNERLATLKRQLLSNEDVQVLEDQVNRSKEEQLRMRMSAEKERQKKQWQKIQEEQQQKRKRLIVPATVLGFLSILLAFFLSWDLLYPVAILFFLFAISQWFAMNRKDSSIDELLQMEETDGKRGEINPVTLSEMKRRLEEHQATQNEIAQIRQHSKTNTIEQIKLDERTNVFEERKRRFHQHMKENKEAYPFLQALDVLYWPDLYHRLENLIERYKELTLDHSTLQTMKKEISECEHQLHQFAKKEIKKPDAILAEIEAFVETYEAKEKEALECKKLLAETTEKCNQVQERMKVYEQELHELLAAAEVETIDAFYKQEKMYREKLEIDRDIQKIEQQLHLQLQHSNWKQNISLDKSQLEMEQREITNKIEQLENEMEQLHQAIARLQTEIASLEMSETYPMLLQQFEMEKESLQHQAMEWAVRKTAKEMLLKTKRSYTDKYLTKVIEKTTAFFQTVTGHRYTAVYPPMEDEPFQVMSADGIRYEAGELSKGTIDQLYISLRLAINEMMSEKLQLPFILDDVFVHFDTTRVQRMLAIVEEISERHQVLLFTCRKEVVQLSNKTPFALVEK